MKVLKTKKKMSGMKNPTDTDEKSDDEVAKLTAEN